MTFQIENRVRNLSLMIFIQEHYDKEVIDHALRQIAKHKFEESEKHLVYSGNYYLNDENFLRSSILAGKGVLRE